MPITGGKSKSRIKRKPLRDVSNGGLKLTITKSVMKKFKPQQEAVTTCSDGRCSDPLDGLLLAHSDLSALIQQIDKLVAQALEQKVRNVKEIESFTTVLNEMQTSLKPWVSKFQKILPDSVIESKNHLETSLENMKITPSINKETSKNLVSLYSDKSDFLVSPSPLVSWRADCATDIGRNLFLLTPLPKRAPVLSKLMKSSKSLKKITTDVTVLPVEPVANNSDVVKTTAENVFTSPEKVIYRNDSIIVSTPYMKMSPPKSCVLLEPSSDWCNKMNDTTKRPVDVDGGSGDSDPSTCQSPFGYLTLKYPELFGVTLASKMKNSRKAVDASPNLGMLMSPPKTCVLLETGDDIEEQIKDVETKLRNAGNIPIVTSCKEGVIDSTPIFKDLDTTILRGQRAGENTLKKELWTRFEAATTHGFHLKSSINQENGNGSGTNKVFMDLLEEVL